MVKGFDKINIQPVHYIIMPSIDCDMNPTAVGNDPKRAGKTGLVYLVIAILFFIATFLRIGKAENKKKKNVAPIIDKKN